MDAAIEVERVCRSFGSGRERVLALDEVSFAIPPGQVVGLLGENGAGKTTLTKILSTMLLPSSGSARVHGFDVVAEPERVRPIAATVLGGDRGLYGLLSARENLRYFGMLGGLPRRTLLARLEPALARVGLTEAADRRVSTFSKGMRQRLHLAIGLLGEPRVLMLDEPTVGLDPVEAERMRGSVRELRERGVTVLLTSHYLQDIAELADRVIMLKRGVVLHDLAVEDFTAGLGFVATIVLQGHGPAPEPGRFGSLVGTSADVAQADGAWTARLRLGAWSPEVLTELTPLLGELRISGMAVEPARLEDVYVRLQTGAAR